MKYYIDITLQPNADIALYFLWEKLYQQLHLALVESQNVDGAVNTGISFPEYNSEKNQLGNILRIFASSKGILENLNINKWLSRLRDYVQIALIKDAPEKVGGYVCFKRIQPKGNNACLARRMAKRKKISYEQALLHFKNREEDQSKLPFIHIKSLSSSNKFQLFIDKTISSKEEAGSFSCYGLSKTATVPWF